MKRSICILLFLFIANQLYAQKRFDVFYLGANENFMQQDSLKRTKNYEASLFANLSVPLFMKDSSIWMTIVDYQSFSINNNYLQTIPHQLTGLTYMHSLFVPAIFINSVKVEHCKFWSFQE